MIVANKIMRQHDETDCGAACLGTIAQKYGLRMSIAQIRDMADTDIAGTNVLGLIKAANKMGFNARGVKGTIDLFKAESSISLPAIAHVVKDEKLLHFIVIFRIDEKYVHVGDPSSGKRKIEITDFIKIWTGVLILLAPNESFEKGNKTKGVLKNFLPLVTPHKWTLAGVILASVIYTVFGIIGTFYYRYLLDQIIPNSEKNILFILSIGVVALYVFQSVISGVRSQLLLFLGKRVDYRLVLDFYNHLIELPIKFFSSYKIGDIISRFQDAGEIRQTITNATIAIIMDTMMLLIGAVVLFKQQVDLFLVTILMAVMYSGIAVVFNRITRLKREKAVEDNANFTSSLIETISGIETIKSHNAQEEVASTTKTRFIAFLQSYFKLSTNINIQTFFYNAIELIGGTVILWIGAYKVISGDISVGTLITFSALSTYFLTPIRNLANMQPQLQTSSVAARRLGEIFDLKPETVSNEHLSDATNWDGAIVFENVTFSYGSRKPVLENINFEIKPGERIAIVGESGSGKSTVAKLLLGLYKIDAGSISIDGTNLNDIDCYSLRQNIAYVSQTPYFFSNTIYENLVLGNKDVEQEKVISATQKAQAESFIVNLPLKYNTKLEENGSNLSGGQRQRLAIAQALIREPHILVLDEATSNLDVITESAIQNALNTACNGITTIIIAHRLSTIKNCDRVIVLRQGQIAEIGTHTDLMLAKGLYYELYSKQLSDVQ